MASRPQRACMVSGCPRPATRGKSRCQEHAREREEAYEAKRVPETRRLYLDPTYRQNRQLRIEQNIATHGKGAPVCEECRRPILVPRNVHCDHIRPHDGDMSLLRDISNMQILCRRCHSSKTARSDGGFGNPMGSKGGAGAISGD